MAVRPDAPGGSGDGWTTCLRGHRHWGLFGAAGLLFVRDSAVLLQLRSARTHAGNTWSVPGGARHAGESATVAAVREAAEELGISPADLTTGAEVVDDHGGWSYTTVAAVLHRADVEMVLNFESDAVRWVPVVDVPQLALHPGFAESWPRVRAALTEGGAA